MEHIYLFMTHKVRMFAQLHSLLKVFSLQPSNKVHELCTHSLWIHMSKSARKILLIGYQNYEFSFKAINMSKDYLNYFAKI